ncbi:MAG: glycosyltransferase family 2 protein [Planctomycetota bacterium]
MALTYISLVIPNRDGREYLEKCLEALVVQTQRPMETIVVDDASQDESVAFLGERFPWVKVLCSSEEGAPQGFARAANVGIRASTGTAVALLNNDTIADKTWLEEMARALERHPRAASASCRMLCRDRRRVNALGLQFRADGTCAALASEEADGPRFDRECEVFGPSGGAALWRRKALEDIGLFDEDFFAYYEDADLAFRARAAGYASVYAPRSRVVHLEARCPSLSRVDKVALRLRNMVWFAALNFPPELLRRQFPGIPFRMRLRYFLKYGLRPWKVEGRAFWKAARMLAFSSGRTAEKREKRLAAHTAHTADLMRWMGRDPFQEPDDPGVIKNSV